jgi:hypothetical protein
MRFPSKKSKLKAKAAAKGALNGGTLFVGAARENRREPPAPFSQPSLRRPMMECAGKQPISATRLPMGAL